MWTLIRAPCPLRSLITWMHACMYHLLLSSWAESMDVQVEAETLDLKGCGP